MTDQVFMALLKSGFDWSGCQADRGISGRSPHSGRAPVYAAKAALLTRNDISSRVGGLAGFYAVPPAQRRARGVGQNLAYSSSAGIGAVHG